MRRMALWIVMLTVAGLLVAASSVARAQPGPAPAADKAARPAAAAKEGVAPSGGDVARVDKASQELQEQSLSQEQWLRQTLILERRRALKPSKIADQAMVERVADLVGEMKVAEARAVAERAEEAISRINYRYLHAVARAQDTGGDAADRQAAQAE